MPYKLRIEYFKPSKDDKGRNIWDDFSQLRSKNWVDENGNPIGEPDRDIDEECAETNPRDEV